MHDDFVEFGVSGRIYDKKDVLGHLADEASFEMEAFDFQSVKLSADTVHLRFKTRQKNREGSSSVSLRSSIWKNNGLQWQMFFHQGTPTAS